MPLYAWEGVDLKGSVHKGILFSPSDKELKALLEGRSIGLLSAHPVSSGRPLSYAAQQEFLSRLASLLSAHIPLHTSLTLIGTLVKGIGVRRAVGGVADLVAEGVPLSQALETWHCADSLALATVKAGEKTGALGSALDHLVKHRALMEVFRKKVRVALRVPCFTLFFFIVSVVGILIGVVPQFELYCTSSNALSATSCWVFYASSFLRSWNALYTFMGISVFILSLITYARSERGRSVKIDGALSSGFMRSFLLRMYTAQLLRGLSLLLGRGVPLVHALKVCTTVSTSHRIQQELTKVMQSVEQGKPLSDALMMSIFASEELHAYIVIGESTGQLNVMISHAAELFQQKVYSNLDWYIACVNPLLVTSLGMLIAGLISAVYMPLLTIPFAMG
ncbi:type II secretion system F family protein [Candidatus Dependentiae bacterium]|nr:type II secretion system F family protein [Candidatus Dependentiae bacterium]